MKAPQLRIAVVGHSGSGKSTCAAMLREYADAQGLGFARIALAKPLYELQKHVYAAARTPLQDGTQDQVLMEDLAGHLRRINPHAFIEGFSAQLADCSAGLVVNDDLRDPVVDAPVLRRLGFRIIRITCQEHLRLSRLAARADLTRTDGSTLALDLIEPHQVIDNSGDLVTYRTAVHAAVRSFQRDCAA